MSFLGFDSNEQRSESSALISENVNNFLILIRLSLYFFIIFFILILNSFFETSIPGITGGKVFIPTENSVFFNIGLLIAFFSLLVFFASKLLSKTLLFYVQAIFDFFIISYLVINTGFAESPFLIFYALIVIYISFFEGIRGGISIILFFTIFVVYTFIYYDLVKDINISNYDFILTISQYCVVFFVVLFFSYFLHKKYAKKEQETAFYEKKLRELENLHELVIENINIGIFVLNSAGSIISCNRSSMEILKFGKSDVIGKKPWQLIPDIQRDMNIVYFKNKYIGYKFQEFSENKTNLGSLLIFQDVTEREHLKKELIEKEKLAFLGEFAAVVAHEIKNPLGAIKGSFHLIKKSGETNKRLIQIVDREISRLELALNNLLFVTRNRSVESGEFSVSNILGGDKSQSKPLLSTILDEFCSYMKDYEVFEKIAFEYDIQNDFQIPFTKEEFYQMFWNLVLNSYENRNDNEIFISSRKENARIAVEYRDRGTGLSRDILDKICQPFFTTKRSGTGLGLYVIKSIMDKYGLPCRFYSIDEVESEGGGFVFHFYI
ncbi:nitrogen regulation protein NR(II) [Flexistipes sinusarabici]|uniref:two-component system sensor histidine kinase NtrB n=1 Tax=Flexistipes sinusarabici TaxID=2352 RepID=UPI0026EB26E5|nr:ATP-binding protein [Flexistipes sinusarabici]